MKKLIFTTVLFLFFLLNVASQLQLSAVGGLNSTFFTGIDVKNNRSFAKADTTNESYSTPPLFGLKLGVVLDFAIGKKMGFRTGLVFNRKGFRVKQTLKSYYINQNKIEYSLDAKFKLNYVDLFRFLFDLTKQRTLLVIKCDMRFHTLECNSRGYRFG